MTGAPLKLAGHVAALALVAVLLVLLGWKLVQDEGGGVARAISAGEPVPAPAFDLPRLDGEGTLSLASLRGKPVIVNFWASWCFPCKEEAPELQGAWEEHRDAGLVVVGIDYDDFRVDALAFAREHGITYPLVVDKDKRAVKAYGLSGVPETFFIDRRGRIVGHIVGGVDVNDETKAEFEALVERLLA